MAQWTALVWVLDSWKTCAWCSIITWGYTPNPNTEKERSNRQEWSGTTEDIEAGLRATGKAAVRETGH